MVLPQHLPRDQRVCSFRLLLITIGFLTLVISGCGSTRAEPSPEEMRSRWTAIARQANADYAESLELAFKRLERASQEASSPEDATFDVLAVHAGGPAAAFSAGVFAGWRQVREPEFALPEFDVVTGSSSGSLVAPFVFVGDEEAYDRLVELFCSMPDDLFGKPNVFSLWPTRSSLVSSDRVAQLIRDELSPSMIERVAAARDTNRDLLVVSVDLDYGVARVWSLAQEALRARSSGDSDRFHRILMASTAVPMVFPPVELDGTLQTDGGIAASAFFGFGRNGLYELADRWAEQHPGTPMPRIRLWLILNRQLSAGYQTVQPRYLDIMMRSNDISMEYDRFKLVLYYANLFEVLNGKRGLRTEFRWMSIPLGVAMPDFVNLSNVQLTRGLIDVGAELGADPMSWHEGEPEIEWFADEMPEPVAIPTVSAICPAQ